ncbi:MAG: O-antigen ligase family protein [Candidatus Omnitrophica bacterium]|nr:O-antigen ligase family protein [Candidatus Omnitrophota bacterium]
MIRTDKIASACDKISEWSLYVCIFALPFAKSIIEITIATALIGLIVKKVLMKESLVFRWSYAESFLALFLIVSAVSLMNTQYPALSIRALFSKSLKFAALFLIAREILNTRQRVRRFVMVAAASCVLILVDGFVQYFITHRDFLHGYVPFKYRNEPGIFIIGFPTASFPFPNDFAAWIIMFIFPAGVYCLCKKEDPRAAIMSALIFFALLYSLILTKARGAWLGFSAALLPMIFFIRLKKALIFLAIIVLFSVLFIKKELIPDIFATVSVNDRVVMWTNGMEILQKHPIIGNGLNTFFVEYKETRKDSDRGKRGSYAHNCYLQMAADIGLVGLAAFLLFAGAVIVKGFRSLSRIRDPAAYAIVLGVNLGLIAFLLHSAVDTNLYSLNLAALFWLAAGVMFAAINVYGERE